jgi:hypothetical protein
MADRCVLDLTAMRFFCSAVCGCVVRYPGYREFLLQDLPKLVLSRTRFPNPPQPDHVFLHPSGQNVTSSSTVNASLEAARDLKSPIILQCSQGGSAFFAGKGIANDSKTQNASVAGAVAAAHFIRAIAPAYGVPVVLHTDHCAKKLLPWMDGMLDADEAYFKEHGVPLFS